VPDAGSVAIFDRNTPVETPNGCTAFSQRPVLPFVPQAGVPDSQLLAATTKAAVGSWIGVAHSPWTPPTWYVTLTLTTGGQYTASGYLTTTPPSNPPAFYYGGVGDETDPSCVSARTWSFTAVGPGSTVGGSIGVPFPSAPGASCHLPSWQGELLNVQLDGPNQRMQLSFETSDGHGPVTYDLYRVCP
jgi:hypothetical protein